VPYDSGFVFVAHPEAHRNAMSYEASYILHNEQVREQKDWNPDWSRRGRGVASYAALRQLGRDGVAALIEGCCDAARSLVTGIAALPGTELVWEPQINQGLVRFLDPRPESTESDHDEWTDAVTGAVLASGEALFSNTTWRGEALHASVSMQLADQCAGCRACSRSSSTGVARKELVRNVKTWAINV
jgi:glutamate/tyrosine decarboxylase-like PLP-dependent enzyme